MIRKWMIPAFSRKQTSEARWWMFAAAFVLGLLLQDAIFAQNLRGNLPPGKAAEHVLQHNPQWTGHQQAVKLIAPAGTTLAHWDSEGFVDFGFSQSLLEMQIGPVYRLKVSDIKGFGDMSLYPSVELLSRLHPPEGEAANFPIPIVITLDDLKQAAEGQLVNKVIYLEDPETALPYEIQEQHMQNRDVIGSEDPLRTARRLGRPMAILRLGSRQPTVQDMHAFAFHGPNARLLPQNVQPKNQAPEIIPEIPGGQDLEPTTGWPPIVDGARKASYTIGDQR